MTRGTWLIVRGLLFIVAVLAFYMTTDAYGAHPGAKPLMDVVFTGALVIVWALLDVAEAIRERKPPTININVYESSTGRTRVEGDEWKDT